MRHLVAGLALAGLACSFPTDKSNEVFVTLTASDTLLARGVIGQGQTDVLFARAWRRLPNGDSVPVANVDFSWFSENNTIARVERRSGGGADVTGVNVGTVAIRAKAVAFEQSLDAGLPVRVAPNFIIDSIRPLTIGYGGRLTVYGVRVNQIFFLDQGFGTLIPDEFSFTGSLQGLGQLDYWVPYPSTSGRPFYFGPGVFGTADDFVTVVPNDVYEPNYAAPSPVDIGGAGGPRSFLGFPVLYYNPALYYEPYDPTTGGPFAIDWYRFARPDTTEAITYILSSQAFDDTAYQYVADSISFDGANYDAPLWLNSPGLGFYLCDGQGFFAARERRTPTTLIALRTQPARAVHLFSNYGKEGGYGVVVVRGYLTQDRRIGPDRFEENENWCRWGHANFDTSTDSTSPNRKRIVIGVAGSGQNGPWLDSTLTIDNAHDIDWYKFRVQPAVLAGLGFPDTLVTIRSKSLPFAGIDFSDIDLYVLRASDGAVLGGSINPGSVEAMSLNLPAGDYFLGVVDAGATPTRYSICIAKINCVAPGTAPPATVAPSVHEIPLLPPIDERIRRLNLPFAVPR